jgi:Fanconi anemia group M protein
MNISITIDHREKTSHLPELLAGEGVVLSYETLKAGDYRVNDQILIERKTADDFALSMLSGRLFRQCSRMRASGLVCLIIVEGDLFGTRHEISAEALQGALLSVMTRWQIPVYRVSDKKETAQAIVRVGLQNMKAETNFAVWQKSGRKSRNSQVYLLRSLPSVGPQLALRLLQAFGSIAKIIQASEKELASVEGIGKKKAEKLFAFFNLDIYKK